MVASVVLKLANRFVSKPEKRQKNTWVSRGSDFYQFLSPLLNPPVFFWGKTVSLHEETSPHSNSLNWFLDSLVSRSKFGPRQKQTIQSRRVPQLDIVRSLKPGSGDEGIDRRSLVPLVESESVREQSWGDS